MTVLKKSAKEKMVRCTHRPDVKPRDLPKKELVRRLLKVKFLPLASATAILQAKTNHYKFRLVNIIFSEECCASAAASNNAQSSEDLHIGSYGDNSPFWRLVEQRFNQGFAPNSVDGPIFANVVHHCHLNFTSLEETINPGKHGTWSSGSTKNVEGCPK